MPSYKVTYFNVTALGEPIRMLLAYGGLDFEDFRFEKEQWPEMKEKMPNGQVPTLEVDGKVMYQSAAVCRYLSTVVGLSGANAWENYEIDNVVDTMNDFRQKVAAWYYEADETLKAQKKKEYEDGKFEEFFLTRLDKIAADNNGYFAAKKANWADLWFLGTFTYVAFMSGKNLSDFVSKYANVKKVYDNTTANANIKKWIETRPKSWDL